MNVKSKRTVLISGGAGKMGKLIIDYLSSKDNFEIIGIFDPSYNPGDYPKIEKIDNLYPDYILEFSSASSVNENIKKWSKLSSDLIIGSSGISDDSLSLLKTLDDNRKVVVIPNFSIGAAYQKLISIALSNHFQSVNIIEKHHKNKQDAPSGTSVDLAASLSDITSKIIEDHKGDHNNVKGINIYSERGEEFLAEQIVNFESEYETFSIEHIVNDRSAYLYGVSLVFDEIENLSNFTLGLETILAKKISIFS